jgi:hypothetical protein
MYSSRHTRRFPAQLDPTRGDLRKANLQVQLLPRYATWVPRLAVTCPYIEYSPVTVLLLNGAEQWMHLTHKVPGAMRSRPDF